MEAAQVSVKEVALRLVDTRLAGAVGAADAAASNPEYSKAPTIIRAMDFNMAV